MGSGAQALWTPLAGRACVCWLQGPRARSVGDGPGRGLGALAFTSTKEGAQAPEINHPVGERGTSGGAPAARDLLLRAVPVGPECVRGEQSRGEQVGP